MVLNDPSPFWQKCCALPPTAAEIEVTVNDQDTFGAEKIGSATVSAAAPFSGALNLTNADHPEWLLDPDLSVVVEIDALPIDAEALAAEAPAAGQRGAEVEHAVHDVALLGFGHRKQLLVHITKNHAGGHQVDLPFSIRFR